MVSETYRSLRKKLNEWILRIESVRGGWRVCYTSFIVVIEFVKETDKMRRVVWGVGEQHQASSWFFEWYFGFRK